MAFTHNGHKWTCPSNTQHVPGNGPVCRTSAGSAVPAIYVAPVPSGGGGMVPSVDNGGGGGGNSGLIIALVLGGVGLALVAGLVFGSKKRKRKRRRR